MFLILLLAPLVAAQFGPPNGQLPPLFPPHIESLIPVETLSKMKSIHENMSLPPQAKHQQIDDLMISLPTEILDKIPPPPGFDHLPQDVQDKFKQLSRDRSVSWVERQAAIRRYVESLPANIKSMIPQPGEGVPPGFDAIPLQTRLKMEQIESDRSLTFRQRHYKIKELMDSLPSDIRAKLPAAPPPPPY